MTPPLFGSPLSTVVGRRKRSREAESMLERIREIALSLIDVEERSHVQILTSSVTEKECDLERGESRQKEFTDDLVTAAAKYLKLGERREK